MTCSVFLLDFDRQNLFQATTPEALALASRTWRADIHHFEPWNRTCLSRIRDVAEPYAWQPERNSEGPTVFICGNCSSTMDAAWHFIENGQMQIWDSVIAVEQTAGRGQQKREWISPAGNIHASWLWPLPNFSDKHETDWGGLLSLMAGFVIAQIFKELKVAVKIKWPNDLLINDRKFGGILVERRESHVVVGTGINVNSSPKDSQLREEFAVCATNLSEQGYGLTPLILWTTLVEKGKSMFETLIQSITPDEFIRIIDTQIAWVGKKVLIRQLNADSFAAVILGLANDGGLRIKKGNRKEVIYSGSIIPA
jgi:BirA family biotin operon repressor/biotin-[acetyl-CoA-carboxylase] ligase